MEDSYKKQISIKGNNLKTWPIRNLETKKTPEEYQVKEIKARMIKIQITNQKKPLKRKCFFINGKE